MPTSRGSPAVRAIEKKGPEGLRRRQVGDEVQNVQDGVSHAIVCAKPAPAQEETQGLPGHPDHHWTAEAGPRRVRVCGQYRLLRLRQFNDGLMTSCSGETGGTNNICRLLLVTIIGS